MTQLSGVLPVISTPFNKSFEIDLPVLRRQIDWLILNGADGVVVAMVSELPRLTHSERAQLGEAVVEHLAGNAYSVLSVGAESTYEAVLHTRHAVRCGATAVMANPPLTASPGREQLLGYYKSIIEAADGLPTVIQDASGYIGRPIGLDLLAQLFNEYGPERVMFKPEAQPLGPRLSALHDLTGGKAKVFEGSGGVALMESFRRGIAGTMPGADLVWSISALWRALEASDFNRAYDISSALAPLLAPLNTLDAYIAVEKYLLVKQGVFEHEYRRLPSEFEFDDFSRAETDRLFDRLVAVAGGPRSLQTP
jgi:dihydrodipicolinate synthase/N-acetylneuraminate lyase